MPARRQSCFILCLKSTSLSNATNSTTISCTVRKVMRKHLTYCPEMSVIGSRSGSIWTKIVAAKNTLPRYRLLRVSMVQPLADGLTMPNESKKLAQTLLELNIYWIPTI